MDEKHEPARQADGAKHSRSSAAIDAHVGGRVRLRRMLLAMTQEGLGARLGVTFQQVQKYEKGVNRISASSLFRLSQELGVPVQYFFDDMPTDDGLRDNAEPPSTIGDQADVGELLRSPASVRLLAAFAHIEDPDIRRSLLRHVLTLAAAITNSQCRILDADG